MNPKSRIERLEQQTGAGLIVGFMRAGETPAECQARELAERGIKDARGVCVVALSELAERGPVGRYP